VRSHLANRGVATAIHYPVPIHRQPAYAVHAQRSLPHTEQAVGEILSLPMHPLMTPAQVEQVIIALQTALV
jgi:UDP-2-acetamido-2-deoxy-ribo-hexuluronate aminotransferase